MTAEDFDRPGRDEREGRGVTGGEIACGVEEDEAGQVGEPSGHLFRRGGEGRGSREGAGGRSHGKRGAGVVR